MNIRMRNDEAQCESFWMMDGGNISLRRDMSSPKTSTRLFLQVAFVLRSKIIWDKYQNAERCGSMRTVLNSFGWVAFKSSNKAVYWSHLFPESKVFCDENYDARQSEKMRDDVDQCVSS